MIQANADMRRANTTFGRWHGVELSDRSNIAYN